MRSSFCERTKMHGKPARFNRCRALLRRSLTCAAVDSNQNTRAPAHVDVELGAERGEAFWRVAVPGVPTVPGLDVFACDLDHSRPGTSNHDRDSSGWLRQEHRMVNAVVLAVKRAPLAREQPPDDLE